MSRGDRVRGESGFGVGGQGGCDRKIEVFVEIQKKLGGGGGWSRGRGLVGSNVGGRG